METPTCWNVPSATVRGQEEMMAAQWESKILRIEHSDHFALGNPQATVAVRISLLLCHIPWQSSMFECLVHPGFLFSCARDCWFLFVFWRTYAQGQEVLLQVCPLVLHSMLKGVVIFYIPNQQQASDENSDTDDWTNQAVLKKCVPLWSLPQNQWHKPVGTERNKQLKAVAFPSLFRFLPWQI